MTLSNAETPADDSPDPLPVDQAILVVPGVVREPDGALRGEMLDLWHRVNRAGGAVGFTDSATRTDVEPMLDAALARVTDGMDALVILRIEGQLVAFAFLVGYSTPLREHWRTVLRVMVDPDRQGEGIGLALMDAVHAEARGLGLEHLQLTLRDGLGLQAFYERAGYRVVGRHPGAIRVADGDDRDEIMLVRTLV